MYSNNPYRIDDIVRYSPRSQHGSSLNYLISKSEDYAISAENRPKNPHEYTGQHQKPTIYSNNNYSARQTTRTYYFTPEIFLKPNRPLTQFINTTEQVQELIEETFSLMLGKKLPQNISIQVCTVEELRQIHSKFGSWSDNIQGFALNNKKLKQILVKNNHLDQLMLTIGHEIGHVYTSCLSNSHDEEAKAFSFTIEWTKTIKANNLGNLAENINDSLDFKPARNGLHDIAFFFVNKLINNGLKPMQVHWDLVKGYVSLFGFYQ